MKDKSFNRISGRALSIVLSLILAALAIGIWIIIRPDPPKTLDPPVPHWAGKAQKTLHASDVTGSLFPTIAIRGNSPYFWFSVTESGFIIFICQRTTKDQEKNRTGLCLVDPRPALRREGITEIVLVEPDVENGNVITAAAAGRWIAYATEAKKQRIWIINIDTGERRQIGTTSLDQVVNQNGPSYAVDALGRVVWADEYDAEGSTQDILRFSGTTQEPDHILYKLPQGMIVEGITMAQDSIFYGTSENTNNGQRYQIYEYSISKGTVVLLPNNDNASQPITTGSYLVMKTGPNFGGGGISLLNLNHHTRRELLPSAEGVTKGCDAPSVGTIGVTWWCQADPRILLWPLTEAAPKVLDQRGGRPYSAGQYIVWGSESLSSTKEAVLVWSDLGPSG